jgi:hypothetical protein
LFPFAGRWCDIQSGLNLAPLLKAALYFLFFVRAGMAAH